MKIEISQNTDAIEINTMTFQNAAQIDRYIRCLRRARDTLWPPKKKIVGEVANKK